MILLPIVVPAAGSLLIFLTPRPLRVLQRAFALLSSLAALLVTVLLFGQKLSLSFPWLGYGIDFDLKMDDFSVFILFIAGFTFLTVIYSVVFMKEYARERQFHGFVMLTSAFVTGAMLANNLVLMLFFWEGLLGLLFALILTAGNQATGTAIKALIINGCADLCLIFGVILTSWLSGSLTMDVIDLPLDNSWSSAAYLLMMVGALAKAGAIPFHSWIPDAASDSPLPFMSFLPASLDKLLGIYLMARLNLNLFQMLPGSTISIIVMVVGCVTIILAVMMALIQKDYKRLLGYHAISQVGYMVLGIGTALPIGIVGGLFHMVNHALYKSCLFFTAGAVERQTGTTDLRQLGGLGRTMPITCAGFLIAALSISGVPPFNGFFSKELVFDAALETHVIYFIVALLGAFFTAASFLKLAHSVYFGNQTSASKKATEAPWPMLVSISVLAFTCVLFGVYNPLPLQTLIEPILGANLEHSLAGLPHNWILAGISVTVLLLALANHFFGVRKSGKPLGAVDHIHYAPGLKTVYDWAEAGSLDPYNFCGKLVDALAITLMAIDRAIDWVYSRLSTGIADLLALGITKAHTGRHWLYVLWVLGGGVVVAAIIFVIGG